MLIQRNFLIGPRASYVRPPENFKAALPFATAHPAPLGRYLQKNVPGEVAQISINQLNAKGRFV